MTITTRIITDFNELLDIENIWNNELVASAENPQLYSQIFVGFMRLCERQGWTPLVITFWANNRIVGMAPLKRLKSFYSNHVYSLVEDVYSDLFF